MGDSMTQNTQARQEVIARIIAQMQEYGIEPDELRPAVAEVRASVKGDLVMRLFSTLGGIFIFAGLSAYIGMFWQSMNSPMRIIITLGVGLVLYALALMWVKKSVSIRAVTSLFLVSIIMQTAGWFVAIDELFNRGSEPRYAVLFVCGVMGLQQLSVFLKYHITTLLFFALFFAYGFTFTVFDLLNARENIVALIMGISMIALAYRYQNTPHSKLSGIGYFLGACGFYYGLGDMLYNTSIEPLYFAITCAMIYVCTLLRSAALLTVTTLAMLGYIGYFTARHFLDSAGWPIVLMLLGAIFFGISRMAWQIKRKYIH
jgi:hypothetical protein